MSKARLDHSPDPKGEFPLAPSEYALYLTFQVARQRDLQLDRAMKPVGLNVAGWRALAVIRRIENCTMSELARIAGADRTTLTRAADQLVARGLVTREHAAKDRRQVNLMLTDEGENLYKQAVLVLLEHNARAVADIDEEELRSAARTLQKLIAGLSQSERTTEEVLTFARTQKTAAGGT